MLAREACKLSDLYIADTIHVFGEMDWRNVTFPQTIFSLVKQHKSRKSHEIGSFPFDSDFLGIIRFAFVSEGEQNSKLSQSTR